MEKLKQRLKNLLAAGKLNESAQKELQAIVHEVSKLEKEITTSSLSEVPFRLLVSAVKDYAIYALSPEGNVSTWNSGAKRIKGYTEAEIIGKHFSIFYPDEANAIKFPQKELEVAAQVGSFEDTGLRVKKDGSKFWANVVITAIYDENEKLSGFIKVTRDITERKEAELKLKKLNEELELRVEERTRQLKEREEEIQEARKAAETANDAKSAFLANMSHEIRTPLGAILGFSELLFNDDMLGEQRASAINAIKRNGKLLTNLISDILDLSKVEAGKLTFEKQPVSLNEMLNDIVSTLSLEASGKGIQMKLLNEVPFDVIETDLTRLRQILLNIVGNAVKFTSQGSVQIQVRQNSETSLIEFVVKDTGRGISEEHAKKLFAPFSQGDHSVTRNFGGTGLGLILSKKLSNALGGDIILAESEPNQGSTFKITIHPGNHWRLKSRTKSLTDVSISEDGKFSGKKILIVDDSPDNQILFKLFLRKYECDIKTADNGFDALKLVETFKPDVVLMDLQMPIMGGVESTAKLRENGYTRPIIALTAHAMKDERDRKRLRRICHKAR